MKFFSEHHRWSAEDAVFKVDALVERYIILNLAALPDVNIRSYNNILADVAVFVYF